MMRLRVGYSADSIDDSVVMVEIKQLHELFIPTVSGCMCIIINLNTPHLTTALYCENIRNCFIRNCFMNTS